MTVSGKLKRKLPEELPVWSFLADETLKVCPMTHSDKPERKLWQTQALMQMRQLSLAQMLIMLLLLLQVLTQASTDRRSPPPRRCRRWARCQG